MAENSLWGSMQLEFLVSDARIVAIKHDGGAIVEGGLSLSFTEGRHWCYYPAGDDGRGGGSQLEYRCAFEVAGKPAPDSGEAVEATIVVTGTHTNGQAIEIRGEGWIGFDENGSIEGQFDEPPTMHIEHPGQDEDEDELVENDAPADRGKLLPFTLRKAGPPRS